MGAWRGFLWPGDQVCLGLGTRQVLRTEVCAFIMGLPSVRPPCWYLASEMSELETHSAAPMGKWTPMALCDLMIGGRVPAVLPGVVLGLALPSHWWQAL